MGQNERWQVDRQQTLNDLVAMVQIDSVNPGLSEGATGEAEIAQWLVQRCESLGLEVTMQESAPNRPNVVACWRGSGDGKSLLLTGHTDTVGVANMERDPFDGKIEDGKLYGRGSVDMKGGLAAILGAVGALKQGGFEPKGNLWLGFVTDEEYYSIGTDALVTLLKPDAAILTEPTDLRLCIAHKGFAWLTLKTHGYAAHGSLYERGVDAIAHMGRLIHELEMMNTTTARLHPLLGRASVHASLINGGLGLSTYPDHCSLQVEHRFLPEESASQLLERWEQVIQKHAAADPKFSAMVRLDFERPGYEVSPDEPIVQTLCESYVDLHDHKPEYMGLWAWLDSAILSAAGIPTVIFGPGGDGLHGAVEYVHTDDVIDCATVIAEATARWVG
jgi:acetylornithine deacetylase